jgi:hypothetical protein
VLLHQDSPELLVSYAWSRAQAIATHPWALMGNTTNVVQPVTAVARRGIFCSVFIREQAYTVRYLDVTSIFIALLNVVNGLRCRGESAVIFSDHMVRI